MKSRPLRLLVQLFSSCSFGLISIGAFFSSPYPCLANLGDSPEQIKARYGETIYKFEGGSTFRFRRPGVETDTVDVAFQDGKSQWEAYHHWKSKGLTEIDSTGSFSKADIESILKANAQDLTWRKQAPKPNDLPGETTFLLGSNDSKTALARAVTNREQHSLAMWLLSYDLDGRPDASTAAKLNALFPPPAETPEPVRPSASSKPGSVPVLKILGQSQATVSETLGKPSNHRPIHKPDKFDGGTEVEYPDGTNWMLFDAAFYKGKLRWFEFFFPKPIPASEDELFKILGLPKAAFSKTSGSNDSTNYRGVADKRVITVVAWQPGPNDGPGFSHKVDIELIDTLN